MMQDGLHIGLAAWIGAQRAADSFVTWPSAPFAAELTDLESIQTAHDLERVAEFSRMVNFSPRKGHYAEPFSAVGVLWEVHRSLLEAMEFAIRPWTEHEDEAWKQAKATLYESGPDGQQVMSTNFRLYDEHRIAYRELQEAGADSSALAMASAEWITTGHKLEIESALATINALAQRSSQPEASEQYHELDPVALPSTVDGSYAATGFSPISAVSTETWLTAEASLDDLEHAVGDAEPRRRWNAWRGARSGTVHFRYAALEIRRPWFTVALYRADDWRLKAESPAASSGNGVGGILPAYVTALYLVVVDDVRVAKPARSPVPTREGPTLRSAVPTPGAAVEPHPRSASTVSARPRVGVIAPTRLSLLDFTAARSGATANARTAAAPVSMTPVRRSEPVSRVASTSVAVLLQPTELRRARFGRIRRVAGPEVTARLAIASRIVRARRAPEPRPADNTVYVAGFGCSPVPAAPNPNPDYQWHLP